MDPTKRYVDGLKAHAHARIDELKLGDLAAEQRHKNVDRFTLSRGGHLRCPECLPHGLKSSLEPCVDPDTQLVCPLCGFRVHRPHMAEHTR
jgi:hypothetical protein